ncbi:MAG: SDR family NAD(P)-dependent oxidoreductase [Sphingomonadales bacterium]|nr:SDR family NAD(P)-dependent oxidoreductase [Sphingomonadales bacterium]
MRGFVESDVPDQTGKCFVVTGANAGIGLATARTLALRGARVLLGCRNADRAQAAMAAIRAEAPQADLADLPLDLGSLASVRAAAAIANAEPRLDGLINNAGLMSAQFGLTADGFEQHIGVNHLGPFALTLLLLPKLAQTGPSRVVVTSSLSHGFGRIDPACWTADRGIGRNRLYADSKLANMLFLSELDRRLRASGGSTIAVGCHPGFAATNFLGEVPPAAEKYQWLMRRFVNTPMQGAWPTLQAACDPQVVAGGYYGPQGPLGTKGPSGPARRSRKARNAGLAAAVWAASLRLTGVAEPACVASAPA